MNIIYLDIKLKKRKKFFGYLNRYVSIFILNYFKDFNFKNSSYNKLKIFNFYNKFVYKILIVIIINVFFKD